MRLSDLVLPAQQRDPRQKPGEEFCYVDIAGVDNEAKTIVVTKRIIGARAPSRARKVIRRGDVIVSTVRPNLNAVALVPDNLDNQICSTGFSVLRPSSKVTSSYLFAFVRSPSFIGCLVARTTGANYPAVNDGEVKDMAIPVPPLPEQERIVKLLDEADELRKLRAQADRRTDALIPSLFHEMFGDLSSNKHHWKEVPLASLGVVVTGNTPPRSDPRNYGDYIEWVKTDNIDAVRGVVTPSTERLSEPGALRGRIVPQGSVLINCIAGSIGRIGDAAITDRKVAVNQQINAIMPRKSVEGAFLLSLVCARKSLIQGRATGGMTRIIKKSLLEAIPVIEAPHSLQLSFSTKVAEIRAMQAEQTASHRCLENLFQSMLHRAFQGEL